MSIFFRFLLIVAIIIIAYSAIKYILNPKRKFELAHEKKEFFFYDDRNRVKKNFLVTYKGVLFEGEKHLGTTERAFDIVRTVVWVRDQEKLNGLDREDFHVIEQEILIHFPSANIEWKSPIKEFLIGEGADPS